MIIFWGLQFCGSVQFRVWLCSCWETKEAVSIQICAGWSQQGCIRTGCHSSTFKSQKFRLILSSHHGAWVRVTRPATLDISCWPDHDFPTLGVSHSCPSTSHCGISALGPWFINPWLLWVPGSVGPSLKWHPLQGTWQSLRLESLTSCCSTGALSLAASGVSHPHYVFIDSVLPSHTIFQEKVLFSVLWSVSLLSLWLTFSL